jgi:lysophospholipase L1-like esterase
MSDIHQALPHKKVLLAAMLIAVVLTRASFAAEELPELEWHAISAKDVCGKGWAETQQPFDRLPAKAQSLVRPAVWELSRHSAGLYVDFTTDAETIAVRWTVTSDRLAMFHMPATGVSGIDLYLHQDDGWHFLGVGRPTESPTNTTELAVGLAKTPATYRAYLPLYNGVSSIEIGVDKGAAFRIEQPAAERRKPVVIYGTSITQGGCASRPGMSYPSILGRRLDVPVLNLGFSGNGKAEPEVAQLLSEIDASVFVIDPLPNLFPEQVTERLPKFLEILRSRRPETPVLLMESPLFPGVPFSTGHDRVSESNENLQRVYQARINAGDRHIALVPACDFTTDGGEATVDGIHPTDVGILKLADALESKLRPLLGQN